jgi:hypothetical protein
MKKNKKIIIFYNNDLRSKVVYSKIIKTKSKYIDSIVEVPSLSNSEFKKKFIFHYFIKLPVELKIYYFTNYLLFPLVSFFFLNRLSNLAKSKKIKSYKYSYPIDPIVFCKEKKINLSNTIIIYGTPNIIKEHDKKYTILNFHDANVEKYRGIFCLHQMMLKKDFNLRSSLIRISRKIDKGDILFMSNEFKVNKFCFFKYTILSWILNTQNIIKLINNLDKKLKYKKNINESYVGLDHLFLNKVRKHKYKLCLEGIYDFITLSFKRN